MGRLFRSDHTAHASLLAVSHQLARAPDRLDPNRDHGVTADLGAELSLQRPCLALLRVRRLRTAVLDEHPLVHRDQSGRAVTRLALLEHAADLRRPVRARTPRGAPDGLGSGRWRCDPRGSAPGTVSADAPGAAR